MSTNVDACLKYIFGLSQTPCECWEPEKPNDFNVSDSGIFLDELPGLNLNMINAARDCSATSLWYKMAQARLQACEDLKEDLMACIRSKTKMRRNPWQGVVGEWTKFTTDLNIQQTYAGLKMRLADIVGGFARLKRIGLVFQANGTLDLQMFSNMDLDPVATFLNLPTQAGKVSWYTLPTQLELDMNSKMSQYIDYYFYYTFTPFNKPKDINTHCLTCGMIFRPGWSENYPQFNSIDPKGNFGWAQYAQFAGIRGNDINAVDQWQNFPYTNGIVLDMQFGCKGEKTICNESLDYDSNPYAKSMAYAARFKAGANLLTDIMHTSDPNYYSVLASELLPITRDNFLKEYKKRIEDYICVPITDPANINDYSDCYTCQEEFGFMKTGLLN